MIINFHVHDEVNFFTGNKSFCFKSKSLFVCDNVERQFAILLCSLDLVAEAELIMVTYRADTHQTMFFFCNKWTKWFWFLTFPQFQWFFRFLSARLNCRLFCDGRTFRDSIVFWNELDWFVYSRSLVCDSDDGDMVMTSTKIPTLLRLWDSLIEQFFVPLEWFVILFVLAIFYYALFPDCFMTFFFWWSLSVNWLLSFTILESPPTHQAMTHLYFLHNVDYIYDYFWPSSIEYIYVTWQISHQILQFQEVTFRKFSKLNFSLVFGSQNASLYSHMLTHFTDFLF